MSGEGRRPSAQVVVLTGQVSARVDAAAIAAGARRVVEEAGWRVAAEVIQRRGVSRARRPGGVKAMDRPLSAATYLGPGKVRELEAVCRDVRATAVVMLNDVSASQRARLAARVAVPVFTVRELASRPQERGTPRRGVV